jgi:hypothetical protein
METNQSINGNQDFYAVPPAFFAVTGKWNLIFGKSRRLLGFGSKGRRDFGCDRSVNFVPVKPNLSIRRSIVNCSNSTHSSELQSLKTSCLLQSTTARETNELQS